MAKCYRCHTTYLLSHLYTHTDNFPQYPYKCRCLNTVPEDIHLHFHHTVDQSIPYYNCIGTLLVWTDTLLRDDTGCSHRNLRLLNSHFLSMRTYSYSYNLQKSWYMFRYWHKAGYRCIRQYRVRKMYLLNENEM